LTVVLPRGSRAEDGGPGVGGDDVMVTAANVGAYVDAHARFLLVDNVREQLDAMRDGFQSVLGV
jgi:hypothetical protein